MDYRKHRVLVPLVGGVPPPGGRGTDRVYLGRSGQHTATEHASMSGSGRPVDGGGVQVNDRSPRRGAQRTPRPRRALIVVVWLLLALLPTSCARADNEPLVESRESLGTIVTVTLYGADREALADAADRAFEVMADVESETNAHDPASPIARFNFAPYQDQPLPVRAAEVMRKARELDVQREFSIALWGVMNLYEFDGPGSVPSEEDLARAVALSHALRVKNLDSSAPLASFVASSADVADEHPGLDVAGAAKGIALQAAMDALVDDTAVAGGMISAGSTTLTLRDKPDGTPWRIGIEDPRSPEQIAAVVEATGTVAVSTSGDYQLAFTRNGVRYHHILDPTTGRPSRNVRSLTVVGRIDGLTSDMLSTALFVVGKSGAERYAKQRGLALFVIDGAGLPSTVQAAPGSGISIAPGAERR